MNKNKVGILLIVILAIILIILLCLIFFQKNKIPSNHLEEESDGFVSENYHSIVCKQNFGESLAQYTLYYNSDQIVLYYDVYEFYKYNSMEGLKNDQEMLLEDYIPYTTIDETNLTITTEIQRKKIDYHEDTKNYEKTVDYHKALYDAAGYACE